MKTKIEFIPSPMFREFSMFGDSKQLIEDIKTKKWVVVDVGVETKTSVRIALHDGKNRFGVDSQVEGLKYLSRVEMNYFEGRSSKKDYLKPKSVEDIQLHVEKTLESIGVDTDGLTLKIYETPCIQTLKAYGKVSA